MGRITFVTVVPALVGSVAAFGQVPLTSFPSGTYYQSFDTLAASGTTTWTDNSTISGWYVLRSVSGGSYTAGDGSSGTGAVYSYGTGSDSERALGSVASGGTGMIGYGLRLVNNTSESFAEILVSYSGEQWRKANNADAQSLSFGYKMGSGLTNPLDSGFTTISGLNFNSPVAAATTASALDGNAAPNRTAISLVVTFEGGTTFDPGEELMLRWVDVDDGGTDHGLAIDDLSVAVPEASGKALLPLAGLAIVFCGWRTRQSRRW